MPALLIKEMPPELHERLKRSAARHRRSMTKEALVLLEEALQAPGVSAEPPSPFRARFPLTQELLDRAKDEGRE